MGSIGSFTSFILVQGRNVVLIFFLASLYVLFSIFPFGWDTSLFLDFFWLMYDEMAMLEENGMC